MLSEIKNFFDKKIVTNDDPEHQLQLATAALLTEMMYQDDKVDDKEINLIKKILAERFGLADHECNKLLELAKKEVSDAVDYHQFTHLIAKQFNREQKITMIESLWSVAFADMKLDLMEEHMVRKIADLIYVSHKDFIKAKHKALNKQAAD